MKSYYINIYRITAQPHQPTASQPDSNQQADSGALPRRLPSTPARAKPLRVKSLRLSVGVLLVEGAREARGPKGPSGPWGAKGPFGPLGGQGALWAPWGSKGPFGPLMPRDFGARIRGYRNLGLGFEVFTHFSSFGLQCRI